MAARIRRLRTFWKRKERESGNRWCLVLSENKACLKVFNKCMRLRDLLYRLNTLSFLCLSVKNEREHFLFQVFNELIGRCIIFKVFTHAITIILAGTNVWLGRKASGSVLVAGRSDSAQYKLCAGKLALKKERLKERRCDPLKWYLFQNNVLKWFKLMMAP